MTSAPLRRLPLRAAAHAATTGVATVVAGRVAAAVAEAAAVAKRSRIECTQLASGVRVITERMPEAHSACVGVWVGVGARDEPESLSGVSHFLEHLLFKGSDTRCARDIAQAIDRVGGDMNAFTAKEYTAYVTRLPSKHVDARHRPARGRAHPAVAPRRRHRGRAAGHPRRAAHGRGHARGPRAHAGVRVALPASTHSGRETAGSVDTVEAIAARDIRSFFAERYGPPAYRGRGSRADRRTSRSSAHVEARFGPARGRLRPCAAHATGVGDAVRSRHSRRSIDQAHVAIGIRRPRPATDPDREALEVLNHVLGGGHVEPPPADDPRGPRARVRRVLGAHRVLRRRGAHDLRRDHSRTSGLRARPHRRGARPARSSTASPPTSSTSPSATSKARSSSASKTPAAACRASAAR